jgi:hypothetical protein
MGDFLVGKRVRAGVPFSRAAASLGYRTPRSETGIFEAENGKIPPCVCRRARRIVHQEGQVDAINSGVLCGNGLITWHDAPLPTFWRHPPRFTPRRVFFVEG